MCRRGNDRRAGRDGKPGPDADEILVYPGNGRNSYWDGGAYRRHPQILRRSRQIEPIPISIDGIPSATADPASLAGMDAPSDHRPVINRFDL
jgi:hypothetical protein